MEIGNSSKVFETFGLGALTCLSIYSVPSISTGAFFKLLEKISDTEFSVIEGIPTPIALTVSSIIVFAVYAVGILVMSFGDSFAKNTIDPRAQHNERLRLVLKNNSEKLWSVYNKIIEQNALLSGLAGIFIILTMALIAPTLFNLFRDDIDRTFIFYAPLSILLIIAFLIRVRINNDGIDYLIEHSSN